MTAALIHFVSPLARRWPLFTLALAAHVCLPHSARSEEKLSALQTALSSTTISGYVNISAHWDLGLQPFIPMPSISVFAASRSNRSQSMTFRFQRTGDTSRALDVFFVINTGRFELKQIQLAPGQREVAVSIEDRRIHFAQVTLRPSATYTLGPSRTATAIAWKG